LASAAYSRRQLVRVDARFGDVGVDAGAEFAHVFDDLRAFGAVQDGGVVEL